MIRTARKVVGDPARRRRGRGPAARRRPRGPLRAGDERWAGPAAGRLAVSRARGRARREPAGERGQSVSLSVSYFTVPPRAHPPVRPRLRLSVASGSARSAAPGLRHKYRELELPNVKRKTVFKC